MKFLILSDIHGSAACLETAFATFEKEADAIILCGDYLNHGPRNPLPQGWDTKKTAELLNQRKDKIICVRGNCDSEVDQMMLTFPCLASYAGHSRFKENPPPLHPPRTSLQPRRAQFLASQRHNRHFRPHSCHFNGRRSRTFLLQPRLHLPPQMR